MTDEILGELPLDRDVAPAGVGRAEIGGGDVQADRTGRRIESSGVGQDIREHRAVGLIAGVGGIQRDRLLIQAVAQEERVDQAAGIAAVEHAVAGADHRLATALSSE